MKLIKTLAMLLAIMLMSSVCAFAETTDDDGILNASLLPAMGLSYTDWMSTAELRAMFSVLFQLDMNLYEETFHVSEYLDTYGIPTIYLAEVPGDLAGDAITMYLFYDAVEGTETGMLVCATYLVSEGWIVGFTNENSLDPAMVMEAFAADGELISNYYIVTFDEYYAALLTIDSILNSEN